MWNKKHTNQNYFYFNFLSCFYSKLKYTMWIQSKHFLNVKLIIQWIPSINSLCRAFYCLEYVFHVVFVRRNPSAVGVLCSSKLRGRKKRTGVTRDGHGLMSGLCLTTMAFIRRKWPNLGVFPSVRHLIALWDRAFK